MAIKQHTATQCCLLAAGGRELLHLTFWQVRKAEVLCSVLGSSSEEAEQRKWESGLYTIFQPGWMLDNKETKKKEKKFTKQEIFSKMDESLLWLAFLFAVSCLVIFFIVIKSWKYLLTLPCWMSVVWFTLLNLFAEWRCMAGRRVGRRNSCCQILY